MEESVIYPSITNRLPLTDKERAQLAAYALRQYFSEKQVGKPWYRPGVTVDNVLEEFTKPTSPISPIFLVELWKDKVSLEGLNSKRKRPAEQTVESYLNREKAVPTYEKWDIKINSMRGDFGGITRAMIAKIASKGLSKISWLLDGVSPEDMSPEADLLLDEKIDRVRQETAIWFAKNLWEHAGRVMRFLAKLNSRGILTKTEFELVTEAEYQTLCELAHLKQEEIVPFLLCDIEEDDNLFRSYQNAVSYFIFADMRLAARSSEDEDETS